MPKYVLPSFSHEAALHAKGLTLVAGVDEAGAGCWAGPVYAAAVILTEPLPSPLVRDSKTLSAKQRDEAAVIIKERAYGWAVGTASAAEIDEINIRQAAALAMRRAVAQLPELPHFVLVDWFEIQGLTVPQRGVKGGDRVSQTIAAASIIAKTERDRLMGELCAMYPAYGFSAHKGYGTQVHQAALKEHGPCAEHRLSYQPVAACQKQRA
jgi:ribonuclease HII